jgi:hypothetical protein
MDDADYLKGEVNTRWLEEKLDHYSAALGA